MSDPLELTLALFARQHGVIHRSQAVELGLRPRRIRTLLDKGAWSIDLPRVYRLVGTPRSFEQQVMAATLWGGDEAVACGGCAAALHGLPGFPQGPVQICVPWTQHQAAPGIRVRRTRKLEPPDRSVVDGIPVTSPARTLVDLAAISSSKQVTRALDHFLVQLALSIPYMWRQLNRIGTRGRKGTPELRVSLSRRYRLGGRAESVSETDLHELLFAESINGWRPQVEIFDGDRLVARPDVVFESDMLVVEMLSWAHHGSSEQRRADARRMNELERLGYTVLQFFWEDVTFDRRYIVEQVRSTLTRLRSRLVAI